MNAQVEWVATVYPDWTTLQFAGAVFAFNRETGKAYKLPSDECPFALIPEPHYTITAKGREMLEGK